MSDRKSWRDKIAPEIIAAIGKPKSGERKVAYWIRWKRWESEEDQRQLSAAMRQVDRAPAPGAEALIRAAIKRLSGPL